MKQQTVFGLLALFVALTFSAHSNAIFWTYPESVGIESCEIIPPDFTFSTEGMIVLASTPEAIATVPSIGEQARCPGKTAIQKDQNVSICNLSQIKDNESCHYSCLGTFLISCVITSR